MRISRIMDVVAASHIANAKRAFRFSFLSGPNVSHFCAFSISNSMGRRMGPTTKVEFLSEQRSQCRCMISLTQPGISRTIRDPWIMVVCANRKFGSRTNPFPNLLLQIGRHVAWWERRTGLRAFSACSQRNLTCYTGLDVPVIYDVLELTGIPMEKPAEDPC